RRATASDPEAVDLSVAVPATAGVNTPALHDALPTYSVQDSDGNPASVQRTVTVTPDNPPTVILLGSASMSILQGSAFNDPGATASDPEDGDLSAAVQVTGSVNTNVPNDYVLTYSVQD